jgi:hypothetical protein
LSKRKLNVTEFAVNLRTFPKEAISEVKVSGLYIRVFMVVYAFKQNTRNIIKNSKASMKLGHSPASADWTRVILAAKTQIEIGPISTLGAPVVLLFLSLLVH